MLRRLFIIGLFICASSSAEEVWMARAYIPSSNNVHGEIRLLKRGDAICAQTLLYSKYLRRGLHEMANAERKAWPEGWPCCEVSSNYLADLDRARDEILRQPAEDSNSVRRMLIEFTLTPLNATYAIGEMELTGPPDALEVTRPRFLVSAPAHHYYISRAIGLMCKQGFGPDSEQLLKSAGWSEAPPPELPIERSFVPR